MKIAISGVLTASLVVTPVFGLEEIATEQDQNQVTEITSQEEAIAIEERELTAECELTVQEIMKEDVDELSQEELAVLSQEDPEFFNYFMQDENGNFVRLEADAKLSVAGANPPSPSVCTPCNCLDISYFQGTPSQADWNKIRAAGITHVFIRCGYSGLKNGSHNSDSCFGTNVNRAIAAGIKVGTYYYSTAVNKSEAISEAQYVNKLLENYRGKLTLAVAYDYETCEGSRLTTNIMKDNGTASCEGFCDTVQAAGWTPMIYASLSVFDKYLNKTTLQNKYQIWVAHWASKCGYSGQYTAWQYTSSGTVNGISGRVDRDIYYEYNPWAPAGFNDAGQMVAYNGEILTNRIAGFGGYLYASNAEGYRIVNTWATIANQTYYYDGAGRAYINKSKTKRKVTVYANPGSVKKGTLKKNKSFYVLRTSGKWSQMANGLWVKTSYTKKTAVYPTYKPSVNKRYSTKMKKKAVSYTGPSTSYIKKKTLKKNKKVTVVGTYGNWAKLTTGYWVPKSKLR